MIHMDQEDIEHLEAVASIYEDTGGTSERMRVLCQLAESLDGDKIRSMKSDAENVHAYPSLSEMGRAEAKAIIHRIEAVEKFRGDLEEIHEL